MNNIKILQIDLKDKQKRQIYSQKLKDFEGQFSYPLGDSRFKIEHGNVDDYFSFFDQMGQTHYFVAEANNKVVGAGCAVLRKSDDDKKYWYLCDFKIAPEYRGKKILEKMLAKYFLKCVVKSHRVVAVNMNNKPIEENGLVKKIQKMFWFLDINVQWLNLHQWNKEQLLQENIQVKDVYTNIGKKDIVIDEKCWDLYHIDHADNLDNNLDNNTTYNRKKENKLSKFQHTAFSSLADTASVMCSVLAKDDKFSKSSISGTGVVISAGMKNVKISTLEI